MSGSLSAATIRISGHHGDEGEAYLARPAEDDKRAAWW
jgi:hypothetical protein